MKLSLIRTDPDRFQWRETPFAQCTVDGIVTDFDEARFDPIPVIRSGRGGVVAGDGHSRFEACRRLAVAEQLPDAWRVGSDWDVPTRWIASDEDALRMAYVANMSRTPFTAIEECRIFERRLELGEDLQEIARSSQRSVGYVRKRLALSVLCKTLRDAVGREWGLDVDKAIVFAEAALRYEISAQTQQELWLRVVSKGDWTPLSLKLFLDRVGPRTRPGNGGGELLFDLSVNVEAVVNDMTTLAKCHREAERGLRRLITYLDGIEDVDDGRLHRLLRLRGQDILRELRTIQENDAAALGALITKGGA